MDKSFPSLVSTEWLARAPRQPDLFLLDASRHLPAAQRDPLADYQASHIPGALFLDLPSLTDKNSPVPAALPTADQVAERFASLGVKADQQIVLYDDSAIKSSARAWFSLKALGVPHVAILDGGLAKWREEGRELQAGAVQHERADLAPLLGAGSDPTSGPSSVVAKAQMLANCESGESQVLDARAAERVYGSGIDPVHGGQNGRIPGSLNLPFDQVFEADGTYKSPETLRALFESAGVDLERPLITSCGSGMTASVLLFAAHLAGKDDARLYDGSWQEWEADPETPKEQSGA